MKAFSYERANSPASAAGAALTHERANFIAGGTNLLDLMKLEIETPRHLIDVNGLGLDKIESTADGGLRIGALVRNTDACRRHHACGATMALLSPRAACRRLRSAPQQGDHRGQSAPAHALSLFLRPEPALQQAQARQRLRGDRGFTPSTRMIGSSEACIATHPSDMAVAMRALDAEVETVHSGGRARETSRSPNSIACPAIRRDSRPRLAPGELITAVTLPKPVGGTQVYRKGPRPRILCFRAGVGRCDRSTPMAPAGSRSAASRPSPGGSRQRRRVAARRQAAFVAQVARRCAADRRKRIQADTGRTHARASVLAEAKG